MNIKYYGVRGSIPAAGAEYSGYGGNTTCVLVTEANTTIIIDAGTGIRKLGKELVRAAGPSGHKINMIFTHYHWDHIMGFPFFAPNFIKGNTINIYGETKYNMSVLDVLKKQQQFINFPVELSGMAAKFDFNEVSSGSSADISPFNVSFLSINHPGGALAIRIKSQKGVFVVVTDYEHFSVPDNKLIDFSKDADILMYDTQFTPEEYPKFVGWGHSTYEEGIKMAQLCGAKELHMCHHAPEHNDEDLDSIQQAAQAKFENAFAVREGWEVEI